MRRRTPPGRLRRAIGDYRDARAHRRWAQSVGYTPRPPRRRRGLILVAVLAAAIAGVMALQPSWSPFANEGAGGGERAAVRAADGPVLGEARRGGVLGVLARFDPASGRIVDAPPNSDWVAVVPDTATWAARDVRAVDVSAWELDAATYRRLQGAAKALRAAIAALRRGGVTAAERARLRRLQMELALVQRALLRHRVAVITRGGVTAAEAAELRRLRTSLLRLERRLVRWRIATLAADGVTTSEAEQIRALRAELRRLYQATAAQREWQPTATASPPAAAEMPAPPTGSTDRWSPPNDDAPVSTPATPPATPTPATPPATPTPATRNPPPPVRRQNPPPPAPAAPADETEDADEPEDEDEDEDEDEPEDAEEPEDDKENRRGGRKRGNG